MLCGWTADAVLGSRHTYLSTVAEESCPIWQQCQVSHLQSVSTSCVSIVQKPSSVELIGKPKVGCPSQAGKRR